MGLVSRKSRRFFSAQFVPNRHPCKSSVKKKARESWARSAKAHGITVAHEPLLDRDDAEDWTDPDPCDGEDPTPDAINIPDDDEDEDEDGDDIRMDRLRVAQYCTYMQANL
jgi:hypothetical protein